MRFVSRIRAAGAALQNKVTNFIDSHPFASFLGVLGLLFVLILVAQQLRKVPPAPAPEPPTPTAVSIYQNGASPSINVTAKIEKTGIFTIMAQSGGVVQKVPVTEGMYVKRGTTLASLSTNYLGGNISTVSRQIAQRSAKFNNETYDLQKQTIAKQKEVAQKKEASESELREINRISIGQTSDLIKLNESIIDGLNKQLKDLDAMNVNGSSDSAILAVKQGKAQVEGGLLQLRSQLRSAEYSLSENQEPAELARLGKDIAIAQLDLQEKSLDLSKDLGNLQVKLAQISESLMFPTTPCNGIVERVFVKPGQTVKPGDPIALVRADDREITAVVEVPSDVAARVSRVEQSTFNLDGNTISITPRYISAEPVENNLHVILYSIPAGYEEHFANGQQVSVTLPLGASVLSTVDTFIPLDAVYQTQEAAFVYVAQEENGSIYARVRTVELGAVSGSYVQVKSGLSESDRVIVTRGMTDGELVSIQ